MKDPIVEEVRQAREEHAKKFGYNLPAIFADIRQQQQKSGYEYVSFPAKRIAASSEE
ncbi:MAG: hypothetical protein WA958_03180 [Tunicatimonas sp.]